MDNSFSPTGYPYRQFSAHARWDIHRTFRIHPLEGHDPTALGEFGNRIRLLLCRAGIRSVEELRLIKDEDLLCVSLLGAVTLAEIREIAPYRTSIKEWLRRWF
jgi:hypothetical protein